MLEDLLTYDEWLEYRYINEEFLEYYDSDIDYEILDDNKSYLENVSISEIPSTPKTTTDESITTNNEHTINDIVFNEEALNHAKKFAVSILENFEQYERDINWLALDDDLQSEYESINTQCVIIDYFEYEGGFRCCFKPVYRPIKQFIGIWELDSKVLDVALKAGTENALTNQDQEFQAILLEEVWSAVVKFLDKKISISKDPNIEQITKVQPPTYFSIRAILRIKKVNLCQLEEKNKRERLQLIYKQDIEKFMPHNTSGRRSQNVVLILLPNSRNIKKKK
ncbi:3174_t:CDS:2 [Scutellospora calospora]|uniref:3174_t:CDS:1 n=1 Tax=Scutellospora calospora TaxID=85575 RepID=A0ACA9JUP5_9GLOM|nr:3174_t:CDS:2 [Scutellospora calospora]